MRLVCSLAFAILSALAPGLGGVARAAEPAPTQADTYPDEVAKALYDGCVKSRDLAADEAKPVCSCYAALVQANIPYSVFARANAELKAKGFDGLDADGKAAVEKNGHDAEYCRLKSSQATGTKEERGTFPESALPALHQSCMGFDDVAADKREKFCACYERQVRARITYRDWLLLSLAIEVRGVEHLDGEESRIFGLVHGARLGCGGPPP